MPPKGLFIFVEGPDDDRFVKGVFNRLIGKSYSWIKTYQYAEKTQVQVCRFIRSINSMGADYIFFTDLDFSPCITFKKDQTCQRYADLSVDKLIIVVKEIESWYLAGLNDSKQNELGLSPTIPPYG